jgi:hypothetical protein
MFCFSQEFPMLEHTVLLVAQVDSSCAMAMSLRLPKYS